jgi:serine/threonine-protein kinase
VAPVPFQPIPDATQVHVDRLVGAHLGAFEAGARVAEGRYGTIYRARQRTSGQEATLEVLRTELTGDDEEVKAANAIKCAGIADVFDFGQLPDGRRYRVMEFLDGESLEQVLARRGRLPPAEVVALLGQVAEVLQAAHAWALPHGSLGPSSVFLVRGAVKLIDFGLVKRQASVEGDLHALGALGFTLLTGEEAGAPQIPELLALFLRELLERRVKDATTTRKELARVSTLLEAPPPSWPSPPAPRRGKTLAWAVLALVLAGAGAAAFFFWPQQVETPAPVEEADSLLLDEAAEVAPDEAEVKVPEPVQPGPRPLSPIVPRRVRPVPSASALMEEISRLDNRFRQQVRPGDDIDGALYVLNKQRLRLSGSPTEQDRKDVARQLAGWRRSYLLRQ